LDFHFPRLLDGGRVVGFLVQAGNQAARQSGARREFASILVVLLVASVFGALSMHPGVHEKRSELRIDGIALGDSGNAVVSRFPFRRWKGRDASGLKILLSQDDSEWDMPEAWALQEIGEGGDGLVVLVGGRKLDGLVSDGDRRLDVAKALGDPVAHCRRRVFWCGSIYGHIPYTDFDVCTYSRGGTIYAWFDSGRVSWVQLTERPQPAGVGPEPGPISTEDLIEK